ncbi:late secretory pathway protein avl9 [Serendipita sp. 401]|nr:late secretory pathway protein avl9 [Serendipita sp. 401]KAG9056465.1 late secretory pathway protein avl9 [Serendipita sp. 407]
MAETKSSINQEPSSPDAEEVGSMHSMSLSDKGQSNVVTTTHDIDEGKLDNLTSLQNEENSNRRLALLDALQDGANVRLAQSKEAQESEPSDEEEIPLSPPNTSLKASLAVETIEPSHIPKQQPTHQLSDAGIPSEKETAKGTGLHPTSPLSATSKSPSTPFAAFQSAPLSAGLMSGSIPSASSNAPFLMRSPSPPMKDLDELGIVPEPDGSTSALRDVRDRRPGDVSETASIISETQRKLRPESVLLPLTRDPLILGLALVDFDHAVGPRIEFHIGSLLDEDEEIVKILPFLALPDGAHMNREDYSYFHLVPAKAGSQTVFAISCNRQIPASELLVKSEVVTRSTVQKAVVVLATKPVFGPIRDKLGVVTQALFNQRDFTETDILVEFYNTLEASLRTQLTESGFYMGTSIRELVHAFRHRTLTLVKALMLQRKIVFYGHPVERLCTFQYSLVSLIPGLLQTLEDSGSPQLATRAPKLKKPTELRTSDRQSMLNFMGLPLDLFGKDAFFQPYLPLQQIDLLSSPSCLCGSTNQMVTQHKEIDMLVNIETSQIEYRTPHVERMIALTPADRMWIDSIVKDVSDTWNENDPQRPLGMQFKGSDDYLRTKFEEYITSALSAVKFRTYQLTDNRSVLPAGDPNTSWEDFGEPFMSSFQATGAYDVWDRITDPVLFDIIEPKHPCEERPGIVSDIGLRLQEGITDLHLEQQLGPTREALGNVLAVGSTGFFKAVEGVRGSVNKVVAQRQTSGGGIGLPSFSNPFASSNSTPPSPNNNSPNPPPVSSPPPSAFPSSAMSSTGAGERKLRPLSLASVASVSSVTSTTENPNAARASSTFTSWGSSVGSFLSNKASRLRESVTSVSSAQEQNPPTPNANLPASTRPSLSTRPSSTVSSPNDHSAPNGTVGNAPISNSATPQ